MDEEISITQARRDFADLVNRVVYGGERIVLTRHNKPMAAIVSAEDYALLQALRSERIDLTSTGPAAGGAGEGAPAPLGPRRIAAEYRPPGRDGGPGRPGFGR